MTTPLIATPVASFKMPETITDLASLVGELTAFHGTDLQIRQHHDDFILFTVGDFCDCAECLEKIDEFRSSYSGFPGMIVCSLCGNKRCPHASSHRFACTKSNEFGQEEILLPEFGGEQ